MTREKAIEMLEKHHMWTGEPSEIVDVRLENEALQMAIQALEQEPCEDCVKRKYILKMLMDIDEAIYVGDGFDYNKWKDKLEQLPSVQPTVTPQESRWIPTSERLPEEDGYYYATVYDTDEDYLYMDIAELEDGIWQYKDYIEVLAWMPLPKPYEPQESEIRSKQA